MTPDALHQDNSHTGYADPLIYFIKAWDGHWCTLFSPCDVPDSNLFYDAESAAARAFAPSVTPV